MMVLMVVEHGKYAFLLRYWCLCTTHGGVCKIQLLCEAKLC